MNAKIKLDYRLISDIEFDGISHTDAPDYADAFICSASYDGREMTQEELDYINDHPDFMYESLMKYLY